MKREKKVAKIVYLYFERLHTHELKLIVSQQVLVFE